jgi:hypothetical protein
MKYNEEHKMQHFPQIMKYASKEIVFCILLTQYYYFEQRNAMFYNVRGTGSKANN